MDGVKEIFVFFCVVLLGLLGFVMVHYLDSGVLTYKEKEFPKMTEEESRALEEALDSWCIIPGVPNYIYFSEVD